jgi:hypothetical protein
METIKRIWKRWFGKEKRLNDEINNLRRNFQVTERGGKLWIVENGIAIHSIDDTLTVTEIINILNQARQAAISYLTTNESEGIQN